MRPVSAFSAWRIRMGTRGLSRTICPSPASVGASTEPRIPASHSVRLGNTSRARSAPSKMVSSRPVLNKRAGRLRMLRNTFRSVRLASVNKQHHQAHLGNGEKNLRIDPGLENPLQGGKRQHACHREHDGRGHHRPLQPPRHQAVQEEKANEDRQRYHRHPRPLTMASRFTASPCSVVLHPQNPTRPTRIRADQSGDPSAAWPAALMCSRSFNSGNGSPPVTRRPRSYSNLSSVPFSRSW